jgi:outer membrane lipoprotein SlyB
MLRQLPSGLGLSGTFAASIGDFAVTPGTKARRRGLVSSQHGETAAMRKILSCAVLAFVVAGMTGAADAKGCIKGAVVGGAAGHFAHHHGALGAAAGCVIGHHEASKNSKPNQQ